MRAVGVMSVVIAAIALIAPASASAQPRPLTGLDAYVEQAMKAWQVPGVAIAIVKNDSVIYARGFGVRELGKPDKVDANTIFAIASTTKAFTAALIGMLVDEKKVRWDDAVALHYPGFRLADPYVTYELTLRDILSHRSGLPRGDYLWYLSPHDRGEVIRRLRFLDPATSFRSAYGYQNIMFLTAGQAAEAVTKESWDDALRRRIFTPLGMRSTSTSVTALRGATNVAVAHDRIDGVLQPIRWPNYDNLAGAGAMNSNVSDMARWLRMQLGRGMFDGKRIISDSVVKEMHTPQTVIRIGKESEEMFPETHFVAYGLGWSLRDYRGRKLVGHGGVLDGMRTEVLMMPEERAGVVVMANLDGTNLPNAIAYRVMDSFLGEPVKDWSALYLAAQSRARMRADSTERAVRADRVAGTQPRFELAKYAGTYADSLYGTVEVKAENNGLVVTMGPHFIGDAEHWHYETFRIAWRDRELGRQFVTFIIDARGRVSELRLEGVGSFRR
jgi:CubicO group peptidase (beta-lactamase class C family)